MPLVQPGQESAASDPWSRFARHHHARPYAALVVRGQLEEAGDRGRFRARAGDVLVHAGFDAHEDRIGRHGATLINFALDAPLAGWFGTVADLDAIVRAHERDPAEAQDLLAREFVPTAPSAGDWPDLLAAELAAGRSLRIEHWADRHGLHPASVSRGFRRAYGVSPKRFRLEQAASRAARRIGACAHPLGAIAADCGFADQAHMTRTLSAMFGLAPSALRAG